MKYGTYFLMTPEDAADYARARLDIFSGDSDLEYAEIGDGNLNYIFKISDRKSGRSVVIKQAGDTARISDEFRVSPDRNRIEYEKMKLDNELAPGLVPRVYSYDDVMQCLAMDDLSDHVIMRDALCRFETFPRFAEDITDYMVKTLLLTCDAVLDHKRKKRLVGDFINPDLCEISEDLVYTEPFNDINSRNDLFPPNADFIRRELYGDKKLLLETAKMKFGFMTHAQSLIHGDLHTGSLFVRNDSTKVIDSEFAFFGPAGYDTGNIIANLIFAWARGDTLIDDERERREFTQWVRETLGEVVRLFSDKWMKLWDERVTETVARYDGFTEWYLDGILQDAAGVAGLELCRRIVGIAHVKDITSIGDDKKRLRAERVCLSIAKMAIFGRESIRTHADYSELIDRAAAAYPRV